MSVSLLPAKDQKRRARVSDRCVVCSMQRACFNLNSRPEQKPPGSILRPQDDKNSSDLFGIKSQTSVGKIELRCTHSFSYHQISYHPMRPDREQHQVDAKGKKNHILSAQNAICVSEYCLLHVNSVITTPQCTALAFPFYPTLLPILPSLRHCLTIRDFICLSERHS